MSTTPIVEILVRPKAAEKDLVVVDALRDNGFLRKTVNKHTRGARHGVFGSTLARHKEIAAMTHASDHLSVPLVAQGSGPAEVEVRRPHLSEGGPHHPSAAEARLFRDHVEDSARRVGAVQRRARSPHELNARQVIEWKTHSRPLLRAEERRCRIPAIDEDGDAAVQRAVEAARIQVVVVDAALCDLHARSELHELWQLTVRRLLGNFVRSHLGHRRGCLDDALIAPRRRRDGQRFAEADVPGHHLFDRGGRVRGHRDVLDRDGVLAERHRERMRSGRDAVEHELAVTTSDDAGLNVVEQNGRAFETGPAFMNDAPFDTPLRALCGFNVVHVRQSATRPDCEKNDGPHPH